MWVWSYGAYHTPHLNFWLTARYWIGLLNVYATTVHTRYIQCVSIHRRTTESVASLYIGLNRYIGLYRA